MSKEEFIKRFEGWYIEILIPKKKNREESFWYRDDNIACAQFPNGKKLYVDTCGEIRVQFEIDGQIYRNHKAVEEAESRKLKDKDLRKIDLFDGWGNNNWFAIREVDINGNIIGDDLGICHDYDEAIELLEVVGLEKMKEYYK